MTASNRDILDDMTKGELIAWIRSRVFSIRPKLSDVLFLRWEAQSASLAVERERENRSLDGVNFKERDELAGQFNNSSCAEDRLRLLKKIERYDKALMEHVARSRKLDKKQSKVDALYRQGELERKKERSVP